METTGFSLLDSAETSGQTTSSGSYNMPLPPSKAPRAREGTETARSAAAPATVPMQIAEANTSSAITVFLDNITTGYGDIEIVLQALVDQNRAFILSQPKAMVTVGGTVPTIIKTTQQIPYEDTVVVGTTAVQTTSFRETGVEMTVTAPEITDDDGNLETNDDTYVRLAVGRDLDDVTGFRHSFKGDGEQIKTETRIDVQPMER